MLALDTIPLNSRGLIRKVQPQDNRSNHAIPEKKKLSNSLQIRSEKNSLYQKPNMLSPSYSGAQETHNAEPSYVKRQHSLAASIAIKTYETFDNEAQYAKSSIVGISEYA